MNARNEIPRQFNTGPRPPIRTQRFETHGDRNDTVPQPRCTGGAEDNDKKDDHKQTGHGFVDGDLIGYNGSTYVKAQANAAGTPAIGMVANASTDKFDIVFGGLHTFKTHGYAKGLYYLDPDTAGAMTATLPGIGDKIQVVAFVLNADEVYVNPIGRSTP